jgi:hypothetical protein
MAMRKMARISRQDAESLAVSALAFVAADPERLGRFLALTGLGPDSIRAAARAPHFLAGILEFLEADERLLLGFAQEAGVDPPEVARARAALSGLDEERDAS